MDKRESNFELLRIVAMLMIVLNHLSGHGVMHVLSTDKAYVLWSSGTVANQIFSSLLRPGGEVGVAIFFAISGFFCIKKEKSNVSKIVLQTSFYGLVFLLIYMVMFIIGIGVDELPVISTSNTLIQNIFTPISGGAYWFVTVFVIIMIALPVLNPFLLKLSKKQFAFIMVFIYWFWYVFGTTGNQFYQLQKGLFFFLLGAFIRLHQKDNTTRTTKIICLITFIIFWVFGGWLSYKVALTESLRINSLGSVLESSKMFNMVKHGLVVPICTYSLFRLFQTWKIEYNKYINSIARVTFGIYLIHDSVVGRILLWKYCFKIEEIYLNSWFPIVTIVITVLIFVVCGGIEYLRIVFVEEKFQKFINKFVGKIKNEKV